MAKQKPSLKATAARFAATRAAGAVISYVGWPVIGIVLAFLAILALIGLAFTMMAFVLASSQDDAINAFNYQCEGRLGASAGYAPSTVFAANSSAPGGIETTHVQAPTTRAAATTTAVPATTTTVPADAATALPTSNPYASISIQSSWPASVRACASAIKSGPFQPPPITTGAATSSGRAAATAANLLVGKVKGSRDAGTLDGPTGDAISPGNLTRYAIAKASNREIIMPATIADQIQYGRRVAPDAIDAGDLVFYNFSATGGPTAVMIAISPTIGINAGEPDKPLALAALPTGNVIVKRVA